MERGEPWGRDAYAVWVRANVERRTEAVRELQAANECDAALLARIDAGEEVEVPPRRPSWMRKTTEYLGLGPDELDDEPLVGGLPGPPGPRRARLSASKRNRVCEYGTLPTAGTTPLPPPT